MKKLTDESKPRKKPAKDSMEKIVRDLAEQMECEYKGRTHNEGESLECEPLAKAYRYAGHEPDDFCLSCRARRLLKEKKHARKN